jgi:gliding motility-associated-like protein
LHGKIFNRWGGVVYATTDYHNDWAGTNTAGVTLPEDTYYYILKGSKGFKHAGFIEVKRAL